MCGIAGLWTLRGTQPDLLAQTARSMADAMPHRGPDDAGVWTDPEAGIGLGHRRLAIVDLTPEGHQPMSSADGRWVLSFNGEIYNYRAIRAELEGVNGRPPWRGHSDTEVLLAAIARWGVRAALARMVGMFAISIWDRTERTLYLVRDRIGEKPLYYGLCGGDFVFGSELKALRAHPGWVGDIDRESVAAFMQYACVPAPRSIYRDVSMLPAGTLLEVRADHLARRALPAPQRYWALTEAIAAGRRSPLLLSPDEAADAVERQISLAIAGQMVADVPVGAFLSGGIDSSAVVALMQAQSIHPVHTFAIGFTEAAYNEASHAAAVAQHLGTHHTELIVRPEQARDVIPTLPDVYDEPFADSSQIPTVLVAALARRHVTVSLSGDGGDEIFGGYSRHWGPDALGRRLTGHPRLVRAAAARVLTAIPTRGWDGLFETLGPVLPAALRVDMPGDRIHHSARLVGATSESDLYERLVSMWGPSEVVVGSAAPGFPDEITAGVGTLGERMMARDMLRYLPDDILTKVDRAGMSVSLETRMPLLDHRLVELVWQLPAEHKLGGGISKRVLRSVLHRHVPAALVERPKQGFSIPVDQWLRGPLRDWGEGLLDGARIRREGFLEPERIRAAWRDHQAGRRNRSHQLWTVLMFQAWLERYGHGA